MSSGNQYDRLFKLFATVAKLVIDGKRNAMKVADTLQSIVDEVQPNFILYLAPAQENGGWITGFDLEQHLITEKLIERCYSLDDKLVQGWINNPSTYPEEFKGKAVFLWKSTRTSDSGRSIACLYWDDYRVVVGWRWLGLRWYGVGPALLASS
jgi:hypothetical protein